MPAVWCANGCGGVVYGSGRYCGSCFKAKLAQFRASCEVAKASAGGEHEEVDWKRACWNLLSLVAVQQQLSKEGTLFLWKKTQQEHKKKVPNVAKVQMDPDDLLALLDIVEGK